MTTPSGTSSSRQPQDPPGAHATAGLSTLRASSIALSAVDAALREAWSELERSAVEPNPFFAPEVLLPAGRLLPGGVDVRLLLVHRADELVLLMPVAVAKQWRVPLPAATTWRHPYRYLGTPLVRPTAIDTAPDAALALLARISPWLVLEQLYLDGPVAQSFRQAAQARRASWVEYDTWDRPAVHARLEQTYLEATLSSRSAKALRRQRRRLAQALGPVWSQDAAQSAAPRALVEQLDAFLDLEAAGWKGRSGTAMACDARHSAFFREACSGLAAAQRLELWHLHAGAAVVASQCHLLAGDTVFHFKTAYDESFGSASPGVQLELDVLSAFHADARLAHLDPCTDHEPGTSVRLYPDRRRMGVALVGLRPAGRLVSRLVPLASWGWRAVRR